MVIKIVLKNLRLGFSLLELSLVMIVISLLIVVTVSARRLLLSAEIGHIVSNTNQLEYSVGVFVSIYESFPGDLSNATSYWKDAEVMDGDGDNKIEVSEYESTNALIQMSLAGIIKSQNWIYDNLYQAYVMESFDYGGATLVSKYTQAGSVRDGFDYAVEEGNYIKFGSGDQYDDEIFTPTELYLIDSKIDNGNAHTGSMVIKLSNDASDNCSDSNGIYITTIKTDSCLSLYRIGILAPE